MEESKIVHCLRLLTTKEWARFLDFLKSPYFNRSEDVIKLFEIIKAKLLQKPKGCLVEKDAAAILWPGTEFPKTKFRKLKSQLLDLCHTFLALQGQQKDIGALEVALLRELNDRGELKYYPQSHKTALRTLEKTARKDLNYFRRLYEIEFEHTRNFISSPGRTGTAPAEATLEALERSFRLEKLVHAHSLKEIERTTGEVSVISGIEDLLEKVDELGEKQAPIFLILAHMYRLADRPDEKKYFFQLKSLLNEHAYKYLKIQALDMYSSLLNFSTRRIHIGQTDWLSEHFGLYKSLLKQELILDNGHINAITFKNIVVVGALNDEWEWIEHFLQGFRNRISGDPSNNAINYCEGLIEYGKGNWEGAERFLNRVLRQIEDVFFGMDARSLLLKVYYEAQNSIGMESLCNSFRVFLDRNKKISQAQRDHYYTFIRFYRRLINTPPFNRSRLQKLKADITVGKVHDRKWLHEKIDRMLAEI